MRCLGLCALLVISISSVGAAQDAASQSTLDDSLAFIERLNKFNAAIAAGKKQLKAKEYVQAEESLKTAIASADASGPRSEAYDLLRQVYSETADIEGMTEIYEYQVVHEVNARSRSREVSRFCKFLQANNALPTAVQKSRERLKDQPNDMVSLGVVAWSGFREKPVAFEARAANKLFAIANRAISARKAEELEAEAKKTRLQREASLAAINWADAENAPRARAAVKLTLSLPAPRDGFEKRVVREGLGDALCLIGDFEQGIKHYQVALELGGIKPEMEWLPQRIKNARMKKPPIEIGAGVEQEN